MYKCKFFINVSNIKNNFNIYVIKLFIYIESYILETKLLYI